MRGIDAEQLFRWGRDEVFNTLIYCESVENMREILGELPTKRLADEKKEEKRAYEICCCLQQGRSYYEAADKALDSVKPLLLYYGMVSFAGAIILAKGTKQSLSKMNRSHGLTPPDFTDAKSVDSCATALTQGRGTFHELVDSCREIRFQIERTLDEGPLARARWGFFFGNEAADFTDVDLDIRGLASRLPDLRRVYELTYQQKPEVFYGGIYLHQEKMCSQPVLAVHMGVHTQNLAAGHPLGVLAMSHPAFVKLALQEFQYDSAAFLPREDGSLECPLPMFTDLNFGTYCVSPFAEGLFLSEICIYYAIMYLLSMLVRYRPDLWMSILHRGEGDRIMALLKTFIQFSFKKFPKLVILEIMPRSDS